MGPSRRLIAIDPRRWRAGAGPIQMVPSRRLIAIDPIERSRATGTLPPSSDHVLPPSVERNRPTPASESLEPFGSPEPAYRVLPLRSVGSTTSEPNAPVVTPVVEGVQLTLAASASAVRQIP